MKRQIFQSKPSGFTLIEFLVASALTMIVVVAAGSTYMMTRKINSTAQERINIQQDLRNAGSLFTRDARNAGSFGCFSTADDPISSKIVSGNHIFPKVTDSSRYITLDESDNNGYGIRLVAQNDVSKTPMNHTGFTAASDMIIFVYGKGFTGVTENIPYSTSANYVLSNLEVENYANDADIAPTVTNRGDLVVSSCSAAYVAKPNGGNGSTTITFNNINAAQLSLAGDTRAEISVTKLYASAYVLGTVNGVSSLLRFDLTADGQWQGPQLLAQNISSMNFQFGYVENCKNNELTTLNQETFRYTDTLDQKNLPAMVRVHLTYNAANPSTGNTVLADYIINATVRSGNACATYVPNS